MTGPTRTAASCWALLLWATAGLAACDGNFVASGPVEICREAGQQCTLDKGPLGVCERENCDGEICFRCTPQH